MLSKMHTTVQPDEHDIYRVSTEANKEMETQLRKMTVQDIISPQVKLTPWVSYLIYPHKDSRNLRVCWDPKDLNIAIIGENLNASKFI